MGLTRGVLFYIIEASNKQGSFTTSQEETMLPIDVFLVRHGESEGNRAVGKWKRNEHSTLPAEFWEHHHSHSRLTDKGKEQAAAAGQWLKNWLKEKKLPRFTQHFVSTHIRTLETAALLGLPDAAWKADFQLREREVGSWGALPDADREIEYRILNGAGRRHHFYTPWPNGEAIVDVCDRLRHFVVALESEDNINNNLNHIVIVAHGDVMYALRVIFEDISPDQYHALSAANTPEFRVGNGQIIHYTRADPMNTGGFESNEHKRFGWVRSVNPWDPAHAGHPWRAIERRGFGSDELLAIAERFPRLVND